MGIIYQPKGKAREYSPLAANLYTGCNHQCQYCYASRLLYGRHDPAQPTARRNLLSEFEKDCKKNYESDKQVLFCFMSDPYNSKEAELELTKDCLKIAYKYKVPIAILTKSILVLRDIEIFKKFESNIKIGFTLTMDNDKDSLEWEPEAALPGERIKALKQLKENGIKTWASFEPVINPEQSLNMMEKALPYCDEYKVGKLNNFKGLDKAVDWNSFLYRTVNLLRSNNKPFYIKDDLRKFANGLKLYGNECLADEFNLSWI